MSSDSGKLKLKAEELRNILLKYNGIPSQKVDKKAYSNVKYYLQTYGNMPEMKALIEEFNLVIPGRLDKNAKLEKVRSILAEHEGIPNSTTERAQYDYIRFFFRDHKQDPEVQKLMYIYASPECYPIKEAALQEPAKGRDIWGRIDSKWYQWRTDSNIRYALYVFETYGTLPARHSKPMEQIWSSIDSYCRFQEKFSQKEKDSLFAFLEYIFQNGYSDAELYGVYRTKDFNKDSTQRKIRQIMIDQGSCTMQFLAENAMPGVILPINFVFFYYYMNAMKRGCIWTIRPLCEIRLEIEDRANTVLFVHYRDYHLCDIDKIRKEAQIGYREWNDYPPTTKEEGMAYAKWKFFHTDWKRLGYEEHFKVVYTTKWDKTQIEYCLENASPNYFNDYGAGKKTDFYLFLLEKGYCTIEQISKELISFARSAEGKDNVTIEKQEFVRDLLSRNHIDY